MDDDGNLTLHEKWAVFQKNAPETLGLGLAWTALWALVFAIDKHTFLAGIICWLIVLIGAAFVGSLTGMMLFLTDAPQCKLGRKSDNGIIGSKFGGDL